MAAARALNVGTSSAEDLPHPGSVDDAAYLADRVALLLHSLIPPAVRRAEQKADSGERGSVVRARDGVLRDVVHEQRPRESARLPRDEIHPHRRPRGRVDRAGAFGAKAPRRRSRREGPSAEGVDPARFFERASPPRRTAQATL